MGGFTFLAVRSFYPRFLQATSWRSLKYIDSDFYKDASPDGLSKKLCGSLRSPRLRVYPRFFRTGPVKHFPECWKFAQNNYLNPAENRILISALKHHNEPK
jgi:hypothetical protein